MFRTRKVHDAGTSNIVGKQLEHIKLDLLDPTTSEPVNAIAFNSADKFDRISSGKPFTLVYTIEENKHHAAGSPIQLLVKDIIFD